MCKSVLALLADDLLAWLHQKPDGAERHVLLWLDPHREFGRLVPYLAPALEQRGAELLRLAPEEGEGQLALKLRLLNGGERAYIVYLLGYDSDALEPHPESGLPGLWALYEYRYTGCVWGRGSKWEPGALPKPLRLYEWLRQHGLEIVEDRGRTTRELADGGADSLLARYAEHHRESLPDMWPRPLRADDVREDLAGDPRDALRALFAAPSHTARGWSDPALVLSHLATEFGLSVPDPLPRDAEGQVNGAALADVFAIQLALTEAWDAFGRPDGFPYHEMLPRTSEQRARQVTFVRNDLMPHARLGPLFLTRMQLLEPSYPLMDWTAGRPGEPAALPELARQRWQAVLSAFDTAATEGLRAAQSWLVEHEAMIVSGADGPWDSTEMTHWNILRKLTDLCANAQTAHQLADSCHDSIELIRSYTDEWWQIDAIHLEILATCVRTSGLEQVRRIADLALFEYVNATSDAFSMVVEQGGTWPPKEQRSVRDIQTELWSMEPNQRRAVIISDAFRWDLAQRAKARDSNQSRTVEIEAVFSTLPSITPFGMTALLPLAQLPPDEAYLNVGYEAKPIIKDGAGRVLSTRDGRKALLQAVVRGSKGEQIVAFADMDQVLAGADIPQEPLMVIFDNDIDQQGHKGGDQFPRLALELVANITRTIDRLHEAGISEVHVVTDHGFLLLPPVEVDALGRPQLPVQQSVRREPRWAALKPDAPVEEVFRLPCPLDPSGPVLGFPRGVRTLQAAEPYEHGGISLQECILPHLVSRTIAQVTRVGVEVSVTRDQLTGGTVPVVLRPTAAQTSLWEAPRPVMVQLWVEVADGPASGLKITDPITIEVRADSDELRPGLYLREDIGVSLPAGQALRLRAVDQETGRDIKAIPLTLLVHWE